MKRLPLAMTMAGLFAAAGCLPSAWAETEKGNGPSADPPASDSFNPMAPVQALIDAIKPHWNPPGRPDINHKWEPPTAEKSLDKLYAENCQGCHGRGENVAGSISMDNPTYLAVISRDQLLSIITNGVAHTGMPAFSEAKGGLVTEEQITILTDGIKSWAKNPPPAGPLPPYSAPLGNATAGKGTFGVFCASCHGQDGKGLEGKAGSVVDPAYLGMTSDQYLRTITIAGRNDLGCPDFQNRVKGRAMTNEEISDVVAWLVSQRKNEFGKPLTSSSLP